MWIRKEKKFGKEKRTISKIRLYWFLMIGGLRDILSKFVINKILIIIFFIIFNANISLAQEYSAYDLLKSCNNYKNWIEIN